MITPAPASVPTSYRHRPETAAQIAYLARVLNVSRSDAVAVAVAVTALAVQKGIVGRDPDYLLDLLVSLGQPPQTPPA